jgi:hypothetical protein
LTGPKAQGVIRLVPTVKAPIRYQVNHVAFMVN